MNNDLMFDFIVGLAKVLFIIAIAVLMFAPLLTLAERKISAWMQDRVGPNRAYVFKRKGKPVTLGGLFHTAADALKMFTKEWTMPAGADRFLFNIAPVLAMFPALLQFAVLPFGPTIEVMGRPIKLQILDVNVGLLLIFAFGSLGVYGAALAGWASNNKLALLGGLRASAQTISYEIVFGLTLVGLMMTFDTVQLDVMVLKQSELMWGIVPKWGVFLQPLAFVLFFTAALAENKRIPFDLPEGESEILGYFVEYSSMGFGVFMAAEFIEMVVIAFLTVGLFFGGYLIPWVTPDALTAWVQEGAGVAHDVATWIAAAIQFGVFMFKVIVALFMQFVIRWALPRFRYDQLMSLGWKIMLPLALVNLGVTGLAILLDGTDGLLTGLGLLVLAVFVVSLFYQKGPKAGAHDSHGHGSHGHDSHGHGQAAGAH